MSIATPNWHERAAALRIDGRAVIDGERRDAASGETFACLSPIDGRLLGAVARGAAADVDAAVASARAAFDDGRWAGKPPAVRKKLLQRFAEKILAARDELALLETLDMGKPIQHSLAVDVPSTARCIAWYAEAVDKVYDEIAPTGRQRAGADHARTDGRGGRHRALELPHDHGRLEAGAGAGGRQLGGAQAQREEPAHGAAAGRTGGRGRHPAGCLQRRAGLRPRGRRSAGPAHGRRRHRLHGIDAHRPAHAGVRRPLQPEARLQRTRRQVGLPRVPRLRRPAARRRHRGRQHVLQPGRELQRAVARAGARERRRGLRGPRRGAGAAVPAGRPAGRRHRDGCAGRRGPAEDGAGLHRRRAGRRRALRRRRPTGACRDRRLVCRADGLRRCRQRHEDRARGDLRPRCWR